jgi:cytidine deaminase
MKEQEIKMHFLQYESGSELEESDRDLLKEARRVTEFAYAPYSNFRVGACALLSNGKIVTGTNQENASFPAGICAERTLLSVAASQFPNIGIKAIAISYHNLNGRSDKPVSPCGICRQSLVEFQQRTQTPIRLILSGMDGSVLVIENAGDLLPLVFSSLDMG